MAQKIIPADESDISVQPTPKTIEYSGLQVIFNSFPDTLFVSGQSKEIIKAVDYLRKIVKEKFDQKIKVILSENLINQSGSFSVQLSLSGDTPIARGQSYSFDFSEQTSVLRITAANLNGLLFGVVTLCELMHFNDNTISLPIVTIKDWSSYSRRIFPAVVEEDDVFPLLDFALKNKIETIALAQRNYPWYEVDDRLQGIFDKIKNWKETYGAPELMQMHNIYHEKKINISDEQDINRLMNVIETGVRSGLRKIMILADDTPPFKFGEGYILPTQAEREKFIHMAEAHCYLMKTIKTRLEEKFAGIELYYVPPFYTYEEMYYGDMSLYKNTPWEQQAYEPLKRDLAYIGQHLPPNIFIIWSGPNVRTRIMKEEDLVDWTNNLAGRVPFLWDNTIYSHHPFTTTPLFTAYDNDLPSDFDKLTAGNGMYINGDINSEENKAAMMTTNDFLWNPESYDPEKSLQTAMEKRYGNQVINLLFEFKDIELTLRRMIGERALWFEADTLWKIIRRTRWITGKNPLYYHLNYNGLKALRMQLKYSVPEPESEDVFIAECNKMNQKRTAILEKIKRVDQALFENLYKIRVSTPIKKENY
jgi:hypothetical protein